MAAVEWQKVPLLVTVPDVATTVRQRIRAAMALSDLDYNELAARIDQRGLGARTLRKFTDEDDPRTPRPYELAAIAAAAGVPLEFLAGDPTQLSAGDAEPPADLETRLAGLEAKLDMILSAMNVGRDALREIAADTSSQRTLADLAARTELPAPSRRGSRRSA